MIKEDYVSFEVAKLLKEKGFDELCIFKYNSEGVRMKAGVAIDEWQNSELDDDECSCVSHQMAMKWLRQTHNIHITISLTSDSYYKYEIHRLHSNYPIELKLSEEVEEYYNQYEQACESAVKYCLENLI